MSIAFGVGQLASNTELLRLESNPPRALAASPASVLSWTCGVGHEPQSLSDVRCPDARSRQTSRPDGVAFSFQVI